MLLPLTSFCFAPCICALVHSKADCMGLKEWHRCRPMTASSVSLIFTNRWSVRSPYSGSGWSPVVSLTLVVLLYFWLCVLPSQRRLERVLCEPQPPCAPLSVFFSRPVVFSQLVMQLWCAAASESVAGCTSDIPQFASEIFLNTISQFCVRLHCCMVVLGCSQLACMSQ